MGAPSPAPSVCLLPLITGSKKQFIPSENSLHSFPHSLSLTHWVTHVRAHREMKNVHKHPAHYAKAPAAGYTSPTGWQEGEERNGGGEFGGGGMWSLGRVCRGWVEEARVRKKCEGVRVTEESRHNDCCYQLCLRAFLRVEKLHWLTHVTTSGFKLYFFYPEFNKKLALYSFELFSRGKSTKIEGIT